MLGEKYDYTALYCTVLLEQYKIKVCRIFEINKCQKSQKVRKIEEILMRKLVIKQAKILRQ